MVQNGGAGFLKRKAKRTNSNAQDSDDDLLAPLKEGAHGAAGVEMVGRPNSGLEHRVHLSSNGFSTGALSMPVCQSEDSLSLSPSVVDY